MAGIVRPGTFEYAKTVVRRAVEDCRGEWVPNGWHGFDLPYRPVAMERPARGLVRITIEDEAIRIHHFSAIHHHVVAWSAEFGPSTPGAVVTAALRVAVELAELGL